MTNAFYKDLETKLGAENFKKVQACSVGIAGAGGLGSNCALNLVRVGFRNITIADFDRIDPSNLDRQFYFADQVGMIKVEALEANLRRINPDIEITSVREKLDKSNIEKVFAGCSVVAECLDRADAKSMLVSELLRLGKFVVSASGLGGWGDSDEITVHRMKKMLAVVGDLRSDICSRPAISPRVNVAAAKQADLILEYVLKG